MVRLRRFMPCTNVLAPHVDLCREELFYQLGLRQFGDFSRLKLEPPPPLRVVVRLAVDAEDGTKHSTLSKTEIVDVRAHFPQVAPP